MSTAGNRLIQGVESKPPEQITLAKRHGSRLAARIGQLGGTITGNPMRFVERAEPPAIELPP